MFAVHRRGDSKGGVSRRQRLPPPVVGDTVLRAIREAALRRAGALGAAGAAAGEMLCYVFAEDLYSPVSGSPPLSVCVAASANVLRVRGRWHR
jgi:hypothetical protein